jgi:hypothetical protein
MRDHLMLAQQAQDAEPTEDSVSSNGDAGFNF